MFWRACAAAWLAAIWLFALPAAAAANAAPANASVSPEAEAFNRSAEALYAAALKGDMAELRKSVRETEQRLRSLPMKGVASAEGIEALARSVAVMKRAIAPVSANPANWQGPAAEIRLAADALVHPDKPMWHRYRAVLAEDVRGIGQALEDTGGIAKAKEALGRLQAHYAIIRTSVLLRSEPYLTERADSVLRYAERVLGAATPDPRLLAGLVPSLQDAMEGLFPGQRDTQTAVIAPAAGPPWGWSALMGTFIVTVLSWAGWQRYRRAEPVTPRGSLPPERRERR
ncbi:sporulation protein YpjB [Cohnella candidum]|uniref:sporulation protein YpjB n=1 Tax=Cohnella candidum TaxID=2674991 RepID=UPI0013DDEC3A|nr:sporulation protein YpjB [Cohnella candidum]